ncbi:hypothetical protein CHITON_1001 [Thermococcus chitonophagus]|uniref:Uncharacterized protein n=1 Tax=Thermococcus chitonophagus TaxID=54262 RepID=A0A160VSH4_9EURY|nr:hypothetical protein CHITON_1001 [Thermococcus chitonophagus]
MIELTQLVLIIFGFFASIVIILILIITVKFKKFFVLMFPEAKGFL